MRARRKDSKKLETWQESLKDWLTNQASLSWVYPPDFVHKLEADQLDCNKVYLAIRRDGNTADIEKLTDQPWPNIYKLVYHAWISDSELVLESV